MLVAIWQARAAHSREDQRVEREREDKQAEALLKATLHARRHRLEITMLSAQLNNLAVSYERLVPSKRFYFCPHPDDAVDDLREIRDSLEKLDLFTLHPLDPLSAHGIAELLGDLDFQIIFHQEKVKGFDAMTPLALQEYVTFSVGKLRAAHTVLDSVWRAYQAKNFEDYPPSR